MAVKTWPLIEAVIGESRRVLLYGPPGTGKTYVGNQYKTGGKETYQITVTEDTSAMELRGMFLPQEDGSFKWQDGPAIAAWRNGARLVINEIDLAGADALTFLHAILDDPEFAFITLPKDPPEKVTPQDGFEVVATMNGFPEDLSSALQDRFPVTIKVDEVNPEAVAALPKELQKVAYNTAVHDDPDRRVSIRVWAEYANLKQKLGNEIAAQACFGERHKDVLAAIALAKTS